MRIKVASAVEVAHARGPEMNQGETVTLFNDICLLAPARFVDREHIQWEPAGPQQARARFTNAGITVSAVLSFNDEGQLVDFVSNDRFMSEDGRSYKSVPWSTPVRAWNKVAGRMIPVAVDLVWRTPQGDDPYGRFTVETIEYNLRTHG